MFFYQLEAARCAGVQIVNTFAAAVIGVELRTARLSKYV
jgi:hypothetical protein